MTQSDMTDLEMTRLCAEAMEHEHFREGAIGVYLVWNGDNPSCATEYDPLRDDAQAMALVKKLKLDIDSGFDGGEDIWTVCGTGGSAESADLNRAIVECVAKMRRKA